MKTYVSWGVTFSMFTITCTYLVIIWYCIFIVLTYIMSQFWILILEHTTLLISSTRVFFNIDKVERLWLWFCIQWVKIMMFNATFNNISVMSWRSVLFVEETGEKVEDVVFQLDMFYTKHTAGKSHSKSSI